MISITLFAKFAYFCLSMAVSAPAQDMDAAKNLLVAKSNFWFLWLIGSTIAVGFGVLGEIPECVYEWQEWRAHRERKPFLEKRDRWSIPVGVIGAILVAVGIAVEGIAEYNAETAETAIRKFDNDRVSQAQKDAGSAKDSAGRTLCALKEAKQELSEIDKKASEADSHLAAALQKAVDLQTELRLLRTPRSLKNVSRLKSSLVNFPRTEYSFMGVANDMESINLLRAIDSTLHDAGWIRVKLLNSNEFGVLNLDVFGDKDFGVPTTAGSGVWIMVKSPVAIPLLESEPSGMRPANVRAADALHAALDASIFPKNPAENVTVLKGDSSSVLILVGAKPLLNLPFATGKPNSNASAKPKANSRR
jgi:hypothetical protein